VRRVGGGAPLAYAVPGCFLRFLDVAWAIPYNNLELALFARQERPVWREQDVG